MKIPDAKATVDKECEKLEKIGFPGLTVGVEGKGVGNRRLCGMTRAVAPVNPGEPQGVLVGDERPGGACVALAECRPLILLTGLCRSSRPEENSSGTISAWRTSGCRSSRASG